MAALQRVAPIFPVRDLSASLAHYQRLGSVTREYEGGGYGYATRRSEPARQVIVRADARSGS